jgi:Tol biopolymer transport system component
MRATLAALTLAALASTLAPGVAGAAFPGRNGRIAYVVHANSAGDGRAIVVSGRRGGGPAVLTGCAHPWGSCGTPAVGHPSWSPDGALLAMSTYTGIRILRADGSLYRALPSLTQHDRGINGDADPSWSPDATRLVFSGTTGFDDGFTDSLVPRIYVVRADGAGLTQIGPEQDCYSPAWSATGLIAAACSDGVYVMSPDGTSIRRITRGIRPAWSPGGRWLAVVRASAHRYPDRAVFVVRARAGARARRLVRGDNPSWSPDGKRIAFTTLRISHGKARSSVSTVRLDGTGRRAIARHAGPPFDEFGPTDWQPLRP